MAANASVNLNSFYVYNSLYGPSEGEEHKKILFFYPNDSTDLDTQIRAVGLCEAVVKFIQTFEPSKPCEAMHTLKAKQFFYQAEENFWMIMTVSVPSTTITVEGQQVIEYHGDDVQDNIYLSILRLSYLMFRFFQGTMQSIMNRLDRDGLCKRLNHFYSRYLMTLRLNQADVTDVFNGIYFLPLDKINFLKVQCFVNLIEATFSQAKYVVFLYNGQLVWSGLEQDDMQILYRYLVSSLFPSYLETELQSVVLSPTKTNLPSFTQTHYGRFVTGPPNVNDVSNIGKVPKIHVNFGSIEEECHLVVYRALSASICLLINSQYQLNSEFYKKLDTFLGPQLTTLASQIAEVYSAKSPNTSAAEQQQFKYIYYNGINLAQKSTMHGINANRVGCGGGGGGVSNISVDIMRLFADISCDLNSLDKVGEIFVKSMSDCWVVGKLSDRRELYVFLNQKNANLMEANDELKKLCSNQFDNIFTID